MDDFIGIIRMFGGNFAIRNYAKCDGQLLSIAQNTALFSILGTTYGGDGRTTFGLPDFRGRVPMNWGSGPGLSSYQIGQRGGVQDVTLNVTQIPQHNHPVQLQVNSGAGDESANNGQYLASHAGAFSEEGNGATLAGLSSGNSGGNLPHTNMQPYLAVTFIICLFGIFPSRN